MLYTKARNKNKIILASTIDEIQMHEERTYEALIASFGCLKLATNFGTYPQKGNAKNFKLANEYISLHSFSINMGSIFRTI